MSAPNLERLEQRAERLLEDREQLMDTLIQFRRDHRLTQKDVAERMGVSQPTVAAFEHYDSNPTLATIQRYAMAVGAVLRTAVIDDCENTMPSAWSAPISRTTSFPAQPSSTRRPVNVDFAGYSHA